MESEIKSDYIIDGDFAKLVRVDDKIKCGRCGRTLALISGESIMIKTQVALKTKDGMVLKCGSCKAFNTITDGEGQKLAV